MFYMTVWSVCFLNMAGAVFLLDNIIVVNWLG